MSSTDPLPPVPGPLAPDEPLLTVGGITAAATAVLAFVAVFWLPLSDDQQAAALAVVAALAPIIVAVVGRARVWSPLAVYRAVQRAKQT